MTIERKLLGTSPSGGATDVAEVFSTFLYRGTGSSQSINNGIDLDGEGGMVWLKSRTEGGSKYTFDSYGRLQYLLADLSTSINELVKLGALSAIGTRSTSSERDQKMVEKGIELSESIGLQLDEIVPISKGGESTSENTQFLKAKVNLNKSDRTV